MSPPTSLIGRYIVCGPAWYRVIGADAGHVYCTVAAGSTHVADRPVTWRRSELRAMQRLGECRVRDGPPPTVLAAHNGLAEIDASATHAPDGRRK